ncbi:TadE/TadG family type IV pilus assembly protein [Sphingosinicella microcystinivorans]|uniref:TadE/TadG family type IV pilus assembly protein n=1 Tax=Sphingosinicella microcystinivorans TaxID=335406 RepID=UPI0022F3F899|nr:TadE/TadG family type IV pilus assembly protein [Sphingosinicella microcystinivorans]WBX83955.1 pilus assembly protein [Sphingosinicella microcystinivorans]
MSIVRALASLRASRIRRDENGVAFMEFAFALPFLMVTLLGGLELVHLALTHQQLSRIATSTADLAARYRASIDETDVNTLFMGSMMSASFDDFNINGRIVLSSVTRNAADNGHWVRWQRCEGNLARSSAIGVQDAGKTGTSIANVNGMVITSPNNVLVAEVTYRYTPWFFPVSNSILRSIAPVFVERDITYTSAFIARELTLNNITNTTSLAAADRKLCN